MVKSQAPGNGRKAVTDAKRLAVVMGASDAKAAADALEALLASLPMMPMPSLPMASLPRMASLPSLPMPSLHAPGVTLTCTAASAIT